MKRKPKATVTVETVTAWAWEIQDNDGKWGLCQWADVQRQHLPMYAKPSSEARRVCVRMIRNRDWLRRARVARPRRKK